MGWKIVISRSASSDLEATVRFIAQHNPDAAAKTGYCLISQTERLIEFPLLGRVEGTPWLKVAREV